MSYLGLDGGQYPVGYADTYCTVRKGKDIRLGSATFPFHVPVKGFCGYCNLKLHSTAKRGLDHGAGRFVTIHAVDHLILEEWDPIDGE